LDGRVRGFLFSVEWCFSSLIGKNVVDCGNKQ
jgi:hypothetical protein